MTIATLDTEGGCISEVGAESERLPDRIPPVAPPQAGSENRAAAESTSDNNLNLMLDVELNVLLRFGQRRLSLREVLELRCGSVVELNRRVEDPVELVLDGRVIARGEAAIVDGNYGLRITEVARPSTAITNGDSWLSEGVVP